MTADEIINAAKIPVDNKSPEKLLSADEILQAYGLNKQKPSFIEQAKNATYGFAGRGHEMATAINPFSTEEDLAKRAAEKKWIDTHSGAGVGSMAADIIAGIPASIAAPEVAGSVLGSGALGVIQNFATTPGTYKERSGSGIAGGAGGLFGGFAGKVIPYAANLAKRSVQPFTDEGKKDILARLLQRVSGQEHLSADDIATRLESAKSLVPGSDPTAGEVAGSGGIAAAQRWAEQADPSNYAYRRMQNANAREAAIKDIAGDPLKRDAAIANREAWAGPYYEQAKQRNVDVDNELLQLLQRPSMGKALSGAESIAAEQGSPISQQMKQQIMSGAPGWQISGEALHHLKIGIDKLLKDPANPLDAETQRAIQGTRGAFESWREKNIPEYAIGQKLYKGFSRPINQMEIGQELYNKVKPALTEHEEFLTRETAQQFANALRNSGKTVKSATGKNYLDYDKVMTPGQKKMINNVAEDLARKATGDELGRGVGSNTFQNFAMQDLGEAAGMVPSALAGIISRIPIVGGGVKSGVQFATKGAEDEMRTILAQTLLDPKKTAELLRRVERTRTYPKQINAIPGIMGASTAVELYRGTNE